MADADMRREGSWDELAEALAREQTVLGHRRIVDNGARMRALRALGVRIALADFGTGYSSLSYLPSLPLATLKIAKPFIDGLAQGERDASFVAMIIELARTLGLEVIAEGIETAEQLEVLRDLRAQLGQGYLLGRPSVAGAGLMEGEAAAAA